MQQYPIGMLTIHIHTKHIPFSRRRKHERIKLVRQALEALAISIVVPTMLVQLFDINYKYVLPGFVGAWFAVD